MNAEVKLKPKYPKCDWCKAEIQLKPVIGGEMKQLKFCSWNCHRNHWEHTHDNFQSDADSGL